MNVKTALKRATEKLKEAKISEPEKSAEFLLRQVLSDSDGGHTYCHFRPPSVIPAEAGIFRRVNSGGNPDVRAWMLANPDYEPSKEQEKKFWQYIERRKKHEPVWYITGKIEFYGLDLEVNQDVLIPRPETEFLVEEALNQIKKEKGKSKKFLELGTGSGAIILAVAKNVKSEMENVKCELFASDISGDALEVAKKNAKRLLSSSVIPAEAGIQASIKSTEKPIIEFRQGDLFEPWTSKKFDIIVANLPYIPHEEMSSLVLDIHHFEPRVALDGGKDGLEIYERLLAQAKDYLNENAMMFFEIGIGQGKKIKQLTKKHLPDAKVIIKKDYSNIDRIAIIKN